VIKIPLCPFMCAGYLSNQHYSWQWTDEKRQGHPAFTANNLPGCFGEECQAWDKNTHDCRLIVNGTTTKW
jgi:hypothetical protein